MNKKLVNKSPVVLFVCTLWCANASVAADLEPAPEQAKPRSAFSETFKDLLNEPSASVPSTTADVAPPVAPAVAPISAPAAQSAVQQGHQSEDKSLTQTQSQQDSQSLDASGAPTELQQEKQSTDNTLAPFRRANNSYANLHGMQLPRPIFMPSNASPALRQAAQTIGNMSVVSAQLVRGAQPSPAALSLLKEAGIKTIVNLRNEDIVVAQEAAAAKRAGLNFVNLPMALFETPTKKQIDKFLSVVDTAGPVFVHCQKGEDRTGTMVAIYRMTHDKWDVNRAYQEMQAMGFKSFLTSLSGAVYDYSAALGHPARRPMPDLSGFTGLIKH